MIEILNGNTVQFLNTGHLEITELFYYVVLFVDNRFAEVKIYKKI